ncbi:C1 family peptidase [Falsiroseomonas oryziterrae]|uniref:hypothetical protein n=1 Tax=Falsiroseomonas oryziterrae TaxID=2911368 RepID=UPI001F3EF8DF|nr:hypothetical protein [Roseomonas sp. NPKOSM-4]
MAELRNLPPDRLARELGLNDIELRYVEEFRVTSVDELHARLRASPSLGERRQGFRYAELLRGLEPLLSPAYSRALAAPPPEIVWGANLTPPGETLAIGNWPGANQPPDLNGENEVIDLLGGLKDVWPVRDQRFTEPTCVPYAVTASLEWQTLNPATGTTRLGSVFLYQRIRNQFPVPMGQGGTKLTEVAAVLPVSGVCREALWSDNNNTTTVPTAAAVQDALTRQRSGPCADLGYNPAARHPPRAARVVLEQLRQGRPVAITIPTFAEQGFTRTNWTDAFTLLTGCVLKKEAHWQRVGGHAVCILGFQPATKDPLGGYFVFRNSWGGRFAEQPNKPAQVAGKPLEPTVPDVGYGVIGADELDAYVTEIMVFP